MEELEIQIEDLKNEAVRAFDREEFADCIDTFEFLSRVNPNDRSLKDYLEPVNSASSKNGARPKRLGLLPRPTEPK